MLRRNKAPAYFQKTIPNRITQRSFCEYECQEELRTTLNPQEPINNVYDDAKLHSVLYPNLNLQSQKKMSIEDKGMAFKISKQPSYSHHQKLAHQNSLLSSQKQIDSEEWYLLNQPNEQYPSPLKKKMKILNNQIYIKSNFESLNQTHTPKIQPITPRKNTLLNHNNLLTHNSYINPRSEPKRAKSHAICPQNSLCLLIEKNGKQKQPESQVEEVNLKPKRINRQLNNRLYSTLQKYRKETHHSQMKKIKLKQKINQPENLDYSRRKAPSQIDKLEQRSLRRQRLRSKANSQLDFKSKKNQFLEYEMDKLSAIAERTHVKEQNTFIPSQSRDHMKRQEKVEISIKTPLLTLKNIIFQKRITSQKVNIKIPKIFSFNMFSSQDSKQDIYKKAVNIFKYLQIEQLIGEINIKKYKNCVVIKSKSITLIWHYQGKIYFGGWKNEFLDEGYKYGLGLQWEPCKYVYYGEFLNNEKSGLGVMKTSKNLLYSGMWNSNRYIGRNAQASQFVEQRESSEHDFK